MPHVLSTSGWLYIDPSGSDHGIQVPMPPNPARTIPHLPKALHEGIFFESYRNHYSYALNVFHPSYALNILHYSYALSILNNIVMVSGAFLTSELLEDLGKQLVGFRFWLRVWPKS